MYHLTIRAAQVCRKATFSSSLTKRWSLTPAKLYSLMLKEFKLNLSHCNKYEVFSVVSAYHKETTTKMYFTYQRNVMKIKSEIC